jgi:hypothetical protein
MYAHNKVEFVNVFKKVVYFIANVSKSLLNSAYTLTNFGWLNTNKFCMAMSLDYFNNILYSC